LCCGACSYFGALPRVKSIKSRPIAQASLLGNFAVGSYLGFASADFCGSIYGAAKGSITVFYGIYWVD